LAAPAGKAVQLTQDDRRSDLGAQTNAPPSGSNVLTKYKEKEKEKQKEVEKKKKKKKQIDINLHTDKNRYAMIAQLAMVSCNCQNRKNASQLQKPFRGQHDLM
jgi:hypothetical protein